MHTGHALHTPHHLLHTALAADLFHHFLHLLVLLKQSIYVGDLGATTAGDTFLSRAVNQIRKPPLFGRHGIDDHTHAFELAVVYLSLGRRGYLAHTRQLIQHAGYTTHVVHLLELVAKVL